MSKLKNFTLSLLLILPMLLLTACSTINVSGRTFRYNKVSIDWGIATEEDKQTFYETNQVANEAELLNVLKTRDNRNSRYTTFGTDNKYTTKNSDNEIIDSGYYKQSESVITLADTEEGLNEEGAYTLQANDKGYIVTIKLDNDLKIFAKYLYTEQD